MHIFSDNLSRNSCIFKISLLRGGSLRYVSLDFRCSKWVQVRKPKGLFRAPPPTKTNFCAHKIVVNEGKLPGPETLQVVGFLFCLVPFRSLPCSSTHQHVLVAARHWTSAKLPSLLHLGTNFILSQRLFFISSCLCSHFVRAETRVKIEVSFWSFNVKEEVAREYFKDFVYTELTLWKAHEV